MANQNPEAEKRHKTRYPVNVPVLVRLENDKGIIRGRKALQNEKLNAVATDLSAGGMRIELEKPLEVGYLSQFELALSPRLNPVNVFAKVVWTTPQGAGLQFLIMNETHRTVLDAYLKTIAPQPAGAHGRVS